MRLPASPRAAPVREPAGTRAIRLGVVIEMELGHRIHAQELTAQFADADDLDVTWLGIELTALRTAGRLLPPLRNDTLRKSVAAAGAVLPRRRDLDVVLVHTQTPGLLLPHLLPRRTAIIISTDGTPANIDELADAYGHAPGPAIAESLKRALTGSVFRSARQVVAWSSWAMTSVIRDYGVAEDRVEVIPPGVDLDWWTPAPVACPSVRLLFVGGDFPRKGGPLLLQALRHVQGDWVLDVVTQVDVSVDDPRVRVHRGLDARDERLRDLFQQCDVFVLPTWGDTYGLVLAQALACGVPVVSTRIAAIPEIVDDGVTGLLVEPGDTAQLTAAVQRLVDDTDLRRKMGAAARRAAKARLDGDRSAARLADHVRRAAHSALS